MHFTLVLLILCVINGASRRVMVWSFFLPRKIEPMLFFQRTLMDFSPRESVMHRKAVKHGPRADCRSLGALRGAEPGPRAPSSAFTLPPPPTHCTKGLGSLKLFSARPQPRCWEGDGLAASRTVETRKVKTVPRPAR